MINKTKIVATIGPSTSSKEMLRKIIARGVNVCRINFSHSSHKQTKQIINNIKEVNKELHSHTAILADLQGPKIRVGKFNKTITLTTNASKKPSILTIKGEVTPPPKETQAPEKKNEGAPLENK